jgi:hypothetical protein
MKPRVLCDEFRNCDGSTFHTVLSLLGMNSYRSMTAVTPAHPNSLDCSEVHVLSYRGLSFPAIVHWGGVARVLLLS